MTTIETAPASPVRLAQILLVEDNRGDVILMNEALGALKLANNLSVAGDGEQALSMLRREGIHADHPRPDLILLDLNLPRVNGREVLDAVKSDPALHDIPVVVLTGSYLLSEIEKNEGLKADGYALKPINLDSLKEIVASIDNFGFSVVILPPAQEGAHGE